MASILTNHKQPVADATTAKPRGLLSVPPEVAEHIENEAAKAEQKLGQSLPVETKQQMLNQAVLDWFYQDQWVAYRESPQGVDVLAVGLDEIGRLATTLPEDQRPKVKTKLV